MLPSLCQWTPLYQAAVRGNVEIVRILADQGADINTKPSARGVGDYNILLFECIALVVTARWEL